MLGDDASRRPQLRPQPGPVGAPPGGVVESQAPTRPSLNNIVALQAASASRGTPPTDPLIGMQLGEYVIQEQIGIGGMGIVYRGEQPLIGKQVAIKVLRPEVDDQSLYVERLLAEARAVNAIRHRGIIDIFSFDQMPDGRQYFVMEYLEGSPLDTWLSRKGALSVQEALRLADELLDALSAAHRAGVIHRDLKPSNIFLVRQPGGGSYVKVLDFGLAKQMSSGQPLPQQTLNGLIIGTPEYMAPEQVRGDPVSARTDLYAFGIILFQLLTGKLPFTARVPAEYLVHHLEHTPPSPLELRPELPPALAQLVLKLLEKSPEARPTADEVRAGLQEVADSLPLPPGPRASREMRSLAMLVAEPAPAPTPPREAPPVSIGPPGTLPRSHALVAMGVAAGSLLLASGVAVFWLRKPAPEPVAVPAPISAPVAETPVKPPLAEPVAEPEPTLERAANPGPAPAPEVIRGVAPRASEPPRVNTERKPLLLVRIERLERKLRASSLSSDEKESARRLLRKARVRAERASTADERKEVNLNLDIWERQYLGN
ncbi:protein kinase [Archangium violaceum]|uniref:serine/threonine-protein kinase n=1 Tax=Archangium violaceum TaxID=83451 RepID=UPI00193C506B|nr:serine/threonine-protein kinase [Archangium violaceum]QRK04353.1 protein kinase [Archangium violaceum]